MRLIDLMPTMLDAAGLPLPEEGIAKSLFPWFESEARRDDLTAYGERVHLGRASVALRDGRYALIHYPDEGRFELYDQRLDPLERRDLAALEPERVEALARRLGRIQRTLAERARRVEGPDEEIDLTPEEMEKLEALGYVGG